MKRKISSSLLKPILALLFILTAPLLASATALAFTFTGSYPASGTTNLPVDLSGGANGGYVIRLVYNSSDNGCNPDTLSGTLSGDGINYNVYTIGSGEDATGNFISVNWADAFNYRAGYIANDPLQPNTNYTFQVNSATLKCNQGTDSLSSPYTITFSTGADTIAPNFFPNSPTATTTTTTATFSWSTNKLTTGNISVNNNTKSDTSLSNTHNVTVSGLSPDTSYTASIKAVDASGNSTSYSLTIKTADAIGIGSGGVGSTSGVSGSDKDSGSSQGSQGTKSAGTGGTNTTSNGTPISQNATPQSTKPKTSPSSTPVKVAGGVGAAGAVGVATASWLGYVPYKKIGLFVGKFILK